MLEALINFSLARRGLVFIFVFFLVGLGIFNFTRLPIDAVPDITNIQVVVNTPAPGYTPLEAEQRITFPIETAMAGLHAYLIPVQYPVMACLKSPSFLKKELISILLASKSASVLMPSEGTCPSRLNLSLAL